MKKKEYRDATTSEIYNDRISKGNNYAHVDGDGNLSAIALQSEQPQQAFASEITNSRFLLQDPYAHLDEDAPNGYSALSSLIVKVENKKERYTIDEIEQKAINLQRLMWKNRHKIWPNIKTTNPISILDPLVAFKLLGYDCDLEQNLGEFIIDGKLIEAAGVIDSNSKKVRISRRFRPDIQHFTAAHELGHAILHMGNGLHRDMPLDGTIKSRDPKEVEANKFAAFFLMPGKLVRETFRRHFLTEAFTLYEATAVALGFHSYDEAMKKCNNLHALSRQLAGASRFNGRHFNSLAIQFNVSVEAMAIRLEELGLVSL